MLQSSHELASLRAVLNRQAGTLRIGRSLRLLGRVNRAVLRDIIDRLDTVRDHDALVRALADAFQECELAAARTEFMIVPDEDDLAYLLDDVAQWDVSTIATLLISLSVVRYPKLDEHEPTEGEQEESMPHGS